MILGVFGVLAYLKRSTFITVFNSYVYGYQIPVIECEDGTYGYNCTNNCSGQCLHNSPCNKYTGHCDNGCNPGYTNSDCIKGKFTNKEINMLH